MDVQRTSRTYEEIKDEARATAAKNGHRVIDDLTDAEFREEAMGNHIWLNAFACVNPTDDFLIDIGRSVLCHLAESDLVDSLIGKTKHVLVHFNKS